MTATYRPQLQVHGDGRPLVFVPGIDGTGGLFYRQIPLLRSRFRVATYRLRDSATHMDTLVSDLEDIRSRLADDRRLILVGESFGGALAMSYALKHPEAVERLVVLNSFPHFRPQMRLKLAVSVLSVLPWRTMTLVRRLTAFRLHSRHTQRPEIRRFLELTRETTKEGYVNRLRILIDYDVRKGLRQLKTPTLFLAADQDHLVPSVQQAELMHQLATGSQMRVLEGHGHICLIAPDVDLAEIFASWHPEPA